jgi:hypothetical protein
VVTFAPKTEAAIRRREEVIMRNQIWTRLLLGLAFLVTPLAAWAATSYTDAEKEVVDAGKTLDTFVADADAA